MNQKMKLDLDLIRRNPAMSRQSPGILLCDQPVETLSTYNNCGDAKDGTFVHKRARSVKLAYFFSEQNFACFRSCFYYPHGNMTLPLFLGTVSSWHECLQSTIGY